MADWPSNVGENSHVGDPEWLPGGADNELQQHLNVMTEWLLLLIILHCIFHCQILFFIINISINIDLKGKPLFEMCCCHGHWPKGGGCKGLPGWFGALFSTFACLPVEVLSYLDNAQIETTHFKKRLLELEFVHSVRAGGSVKFLPVV